MITADRADIQDPHRRTGHPWWRAAGLLLGAVAAWSLLSQALGTLLFDRSWPEGKPGSLVGTLAFLVVIAASAALARRGRSPRRRASQRRART